MPINKITKLCKSYDDAMQFLIANNTKLLNVETSDIEIKQLDDERTELTIINHFNNDSIIQH